MLVEVVLGVRPSSGFSVRVVAVDRDEDRLRVRAVEDAPGPWAVFDLNGPDVGGRAAAPPQPGSPGAIPASCWRHFGPSTR
jgi:hypothetical protein